MRAFITGLMTLTTMVGPAARAASTLQIVERPDHETTIDLGTPGDSVGDLLAFANELFDSSNKQKVGASQGSCVRTIVGKSWECNFTLLLAEGQMSVQGPFSDSGNSLFAITGGTGRYAGAGGSLTLTQRPGEATSYTFTIALR